MTSTTRHIGLVALTAAAAGGCAAAAVFLATPTAETPAPAPARTSDTPLVGMPLQVVLPSVPAPTSSITIKDFLVPLGTLLGAALGFGGAVTGARLSANAQAEGARRDAKIKSQEEDRTRALERLQTFADQANSLIGDLVPLVSSRPEGWRSETAEQREQIRLRATQLLGASRLLPTDLEPSVHEFISAALATADSQQAQQARQAAQRCGAAFEVLMRAVSAKLSPETTDHASA